MSLRTRTVLAALLTGGFYLFALTIALGLLAFPVLTVVFAHELFLRPAIVGVAAGAAILYSIVPRRLPFVPPGPRLDLSRQPRLAAELEAIAEAVGAQAPSEVYMEMAVNAGVLEAGGRLGFGTRRVMVIGLPLLRALTLSEFRAVMVHEFGHYQAGDTRLTPWIYRARIAILETVRHVGRRSWMLRLPFVAYGVLFLRLTQAVARRQELAADALGAEAAGRDAMAGALTAVVAGWFVYGEFWKQEMWPALKGGFRPPLLEGFGRFTGVPRVQLAVNQKLHGEMNAPRRDPYDSHPPLGERLAALEGAPRHARPAVDPPASTLLDGLPQLELDLLAHVVGSGVINSEAVGWDELAERQYLPGYRANVLRYGDLFAGASVSQLPDVLARSTQLGQLIRERAGGPAASPEEAIDITWRTVACCLTASLVDAEWTFTMPMEGTATLSRHGLPPLEPFDAVIGLGQGKLRPDEWLAWCRASGTGDVELAPARRDQAVVSGVEQPS